MRTRVEVFTSGVWQMSSLVVLEGSACVVVDAGFFPQELAALSRFVAKRAGSRRWPSPMRTGTTSSGRSPTRTRPCCAASRWRAGSPKMPSRRAPVWRRRPASTRSGTCNALHGMAWDAGLLGAGFGSRYYTGNIHNGSAAWRARAEGRRERAAERLLMLLGRRAQAGKE